MLKKSSRKVYLLYMELNCQRANILLKEINLSRRSGDELVVLCRKNTRMFASVPCIYGHHYYIKDARKNCLRR